MKLNSLQLLRGIAAFLVAVEHTQSIFAKRFESLDWSGHEFTGVQGVDLFFVISGFVMAHLTWQSHPSKAAARIFLLERAARIIPLYWLTTTIFIVLFGFFKHSSFSIEHIIRSLLFIPSFPLDDGHAAPVFSLGWTLNYEFYFYVWMALGIWLLGKRAWIGATLGIMTVVASATLLPTESALVLTYTDPIVFEFLLGIAVRKLIAKGYFNNFSSVTAFLIGLALFVPTLMGLSWCGDAHRVWVYGLPSALLVYGLVGLETAGYSYKRATAFVKLGDWSYSLYLLHLFPIWIICDGLQMIGVTDQPKFIIYLLLILTMFIQISLAGVGFYFVEKPAQNKLRRYFI